MARSEAALGESALVIGAGPIGLSVVQFLQVAGAPVIVLDTNPRRLEFCRSALHVEHTVTASETALDVIRTLTGGDLPTLVFDATGSAASMQGSFQYVANGGRLVFVGLVQDSIPIHDPEFHRKEITLLASRNSTPADFRRIIGLIEEGKIDTTPWITHRAELVEVPERFAGWLKPEAGVIKAMIEVG